MIEGDDIVPHVYLRSTLPIACSVKRPNGDLDLCKYSLDIDSSGNLMNDTLSSSPFVSGII